MGVGFQGLCPACASVMHARARCQNYGSR